MVFSSLVFLYRFLPAVLLLSFLCPKKHQNALLLAGTIMSVRIIGSSFATSALEVVILKTLHMFEVPFLLVGCF